VELDRHYFAEMRVDENHVPSGHLVQTDLVQVKFHPRVVAVQKINFVDLVQLMVIENFDQILAQYI